MFLQELRELEDKYKMGREVEIGNNSAIITTGIIKFRDFYAIYADFLKNPDGISCCTTKIHDKVAIIVRDKKMLLEYELNTQERKAIYCHELGHCFSIDQKKSEGNKREVYNEIDSDTFAVKQCDISPFVLKSALSKTYGHDIKNICKRTDLTQEKINNYSQEMELRLANIQKLIREFEFKEVR